MLFNYTTELRNYIEQLSYPIQHQSTRELIEAGRTKLFDFDYEIFDVAYKKTFETHFIRKFYMRQIGFETVGLFKFQLETWMIINMPYFNKLFESELLQYDPLSNTKTDSTYKKISDKTQNDNRNVEDTKIIDGETQSDSNRIGNTINTDNSTTTNNEDSTTTNNNTSTTTNTENSNVNNKENSSKSSDTENTQSKDESNSTVDDNFNRQLNSDNPDSRLALTANDGQGVIEYASKIQENNENNSRITTANETNTIKESSHENSDNESTLISDKDSLSTIENESIAIFENESTLVSTKDATTNTNENLTDNSKSNITQNDTTNDTLISNINNMEDFVEHRVGKIGTQSFSKLIQDYRSSMMRIENRIFEEMSELFMLVY